MFFYAIDGDDIGQKLERLILEEKLDEVSNLSLSMTKAIDTLKEYMLTRGASIIFCAGDGLLAQSSELINVNNLIYDPSRISFSIGIGDSPSNSLLALKKAKGLGKARLETQFTRKL